MVTERGFYQKFGYAWEIEPIQPDWIIEESAAQPFAGFDFQVLLVPGHCPGSLCFLAKEAAILFGGDVLLRAASGVGICRAAMANCSSAAFAKQLYPLGDEITVLPGHGPPRRSASSAAPILTCTISGRVAAAHIRSGTSIPSSPSP